MAVVQLTNRKVVEITGEDRLKFLQGIITADIYKLSTDCGLYSCILNPQGKILFDFFLYDAGERVLLDVDYSQLEGLLKKLRMYKLRSRVAIEERSDLVVFAGWQETCLPFEGVVKVSDPRLKELGWRTIAAAMQSDDDGLALYNERRVAFGIADSEDYVREKAYPAEYGLEALGAVSATKGCYVGQEVVARMRSRGNVKRTIVIIKSDETLPETDALIMQEGKEVGQLRTVCGNIALGVVRIEVLQNGHQLKVDPTGVSATLPDWLVSFQEAHNSRQAP